MTYTNLRHLGTNYQEWINTLEFYKQDLNILDKRLLEVASKNSGHEAGAGIEHFQNQFNIQERNINDLMHRIRLNERQAAGDVQSHASHIEVDVVNTKAVISGDMKQFEDMMKSLRQEFNSFLAKWM